MAEFSAGFKIYADASQFHREMKEAAEGAKRVQKGFRELGVNLGQFLGVGAVLGGFSRVLASAQEIRAELERQGKAVDESTRKVAEYADAWDGLKKGVVGAGVEVLSFFNKAGEGLGMLAKAQVRETKGFFGTLFSGDVKGAFAQIGQGFRSVREEEQALARTARELEETERRIVNEKRSRALEADKAKKADEEAMKIAREELREAEKRKEVGREIAAFEREQARARMDAQGRINDLRREDRDLTRQIAEYEKFGRDNLSSGALQEFLDLKKQQADVQTRIREETEKAAKAEAQGQKVLEQKLETLAGIAGIRTSRQFGDASDEALQESIRRNEQAIFGIGPVRNIGQDFEVARLQSEIVNLRQELDFRAGLRRDVQMLGVEGARRNFAGDPLAFDRVVQQLVQDNRDTTDLLRVVARTQEDFQKALRNGLPVINLNSPTGG